MGEPDGHAGLPEGRRTPPGSTSGPRKVLGAGTQVLADGHDLDADRPQVGQRGEHLVLVLAHPDDECPTWW